jgi:hypothetical protein
MDHRKGVCDPSDHMDVRVSARRLCRTGKVAFHKKSTRGIETPHRHMEVIKQRYKEAVSEWENES